jgi:hypothetical protein
MVVKNPVRVLVPLLEFNLLAINAKVLLLFPLLIQ